MGKPELAYAKPFACLPGSIAGSSSIELVEFVNEPQTLEELEEVRAAIRRERPYGDIEWVARTAKSLGFTYSITPRGRPRKREHVLASTPETGASRLEK